jgi:8-oxo-dGTP pyrophosphatase MutT (NUDIX family)
MRLSDLITPTTPSGTALFLQWQGYHVFSIPKREIVRSPQSVRFCGVGGKRKNAAESFADCALRESQEEIGDVVDHLDSAAKTYLLTADGTLQTVEIEDEPIRPRFIFEKHRHTDHGSMAQSERSYYLVAFNAHLRAKPQPRKEIAAILYLKDEQLASIKAKSSISLEEFLKTGGKIDYQMNIQMNIQINETAQLIPHGTVHLLLKLP